jgi:hypothetical protein
MNRVANAVRTDQGSLEAALVMPSTRQAVWVRNTGPLRVSLSSAFRVQDSVFHNHSRCHVAQEDTDGPATGIGAGSGVAASSAAVAASRFRDLRDVR